MRILLLVLWMLIPVGALAYHMGPGQTDMKRDQVSQLLADADQLVLDEKWSEAKQIYTNALELLPENEVATNRRTRLELAKCEINDKGLPQANEDLKVLVNELMEDSGSDPRLLEDARMALANSQFYITWLMRLEGRSPDVWEPEITSSQQMYRLLAENAERDGDQEMINIRRSDLESAVKLARMDIGELQGLPLPSQ